MNAKTVSALVVGAILIAALAFVLRHEPPPGADAANEDRATPHEAAAVPARQPLRADASAAPGDAPPRSASPAQPGAPLPQPSPPTPSTDALEELKLPPIPELLETERAFAAEAVDPSWSREAEAHILGEIAQVTGLKLVTLRVECRTTLCRLHVAQQELQHGPGPILEIVARLGMKTRWVLSVVDRNGVPASLAYLERGRAEPGAPTAGADIEIRR